MNSDISHASDCVFYDSELRQLRRSFDDAAKVLKDIQKRAERRQTVQISKSLFDYCERRHDFKACPQKYFDFRMDNYRVCVYVHRGKFGVLCVGFDYNSPANEVTSFVGAGKLYYACNYLSDVVIYFRQIVLYFVENYVAKYDFNSLDIPF